MGFHAKKFRISLDRTAPTALTTESLQRSLHLIGLTCPDTGLPKLSKHITDVKSKISSGRLQAFAIMRPTSAAKAAARRLGEAFPPPTFIGSVDLRNAVETAVEANWRPSATALGFATKLGLIQEKKHFDFLKQRRPGFLGNEHSPAGQSQRYDTVDAIKTMFVNVARAASAVTISGIDKSDMEAVLSNIISPLSDESAKDYNETDSRVILLVDNYNPDTEYADGIGFVTISWHLTIRNYKEKKSNPQHDTTLTISAWGATYDDPEVLEGDVRMIKLNFNLPDFLANRSLSAAPVNGVAVAKRSALPAAPVNALAVAAGSALPVDTGSALPDAPANALAVATRSALPAAPVNDLQMLTRAGFLGQKKTIQIFDSRPGANESTFNQSLPKKFTTGAMEAIVLYSPNLRLLGSLDNTRSKAESTWEKAVSHGFTFETTQSISLETSVVATSGVVTGSFTYSIGVSFTQGVSKAESLTTSVTVPAGQKAFVYQGTLRSEVLRFTPSTNSYTWQEKAEFLTDVLITSENPLPNV
jgi:hypothetical protein